MLATPGELAPLPRGNPRSATESIIVAATVVIKAWSDEYLNKEKAYEDLLEALRKINKNSWISDINRD